MFVCVQTKYTPYESMLWNVEFISIWIRGSGSFNQKIIFFIIVLYLSIMPETMRLLFICVKYVICFKKLYSCFLVDFYEDFPQFVAARIREAEMKRIEADP